MQREGSDPQALTKQDRFCPRCDLPVELDWSNAPQVLQHMATHIRHDRGLVATFESPCGFCLCPHPQCVFWTPRNPCAGHGGPQVDLKKSTGCERARGFKYKAASTSKPNSPSTNVPITCPLCADGSPAVWKYNFPQHLAHVHPRQDPARFAHLSKTSSAEEYGVKASWESRHVVRRTTHNAKAPLQLSVDHRCVLPTM
ncbi:hypothetical protein AURDEDRAFT_74160 [Auricularia subglabra TFB-10046 SS5]|uniref:Uncharacterized protein n=1 Tax=Auricularia subglabra (strain TFB-10046 / SS5) TaxID=717982 RepID=J0WT57_AURST|nr:hypothetical protein AURDEDRAFT_74160 [Auricularia subglabra TFB-10046 SS5]